MECRIAGNPPVVAARLAGFREPRREAVAMEKNLAVKDAIEYTLKERTYQRTLTRNDVLAGLMDAVNMAQTATEMVAAWREIGKVIGAYEPTKLDVQITKPEQLRELNDRELLELSAIEGELVDFNESIEDADFTEVTDDQDPGSTHDARSTEHVDRGSGDSAPGGEER